MSEEKVYGITEFRQAAVVLSYCSEWFLMRFTAEELLQLSRAICSCNRYVPPEDWTEQQVLQAIMGRTPDWDEVLDSEGRVHLHSKNVTDCWCSECQFKKRGQKEEPS